MINRLIRIFNTTQLTYIFNNFFITFLFLLLLVFGHEKEAIEIIYYSSVPLFITQMFSINARNTGLADRDIYSLSKNLSLRLTLSPFFLILSILIYLIVLGEDFNFLLLFTNLIVFKMWIIELTIALYEVKKKVKNVLFYFIYIFIVIILIIFYESNSFYYYFSAISLTNLILIIYFLFYIKLEFIYPKKFNFIKKNFFEKSFYSSFALTFLNLMIRLLLYKYYIYDDLELIYLLISIYSLPGSLVTNSYGVSILSNNKPTPILFKLLIVGYFLSILYILTRFYFDFKHYIEFHELSVDAKYLLLALISGVIQNANQNVRIIRFSNTYVRNDIFIADVLFSVICLLNLVIFIVFIQSHLIYFIFINAILGFLIYLEYKKDSFHKID